jgi:beta-carotene hydroxylase
MAAVHYWLAPFTLAACYLMYAFDYLPHRPHTEQHNPYQATSLVTLGWPLDGLVPQRVVTALLLGQNYHNVHHLAPSYPFYRYGDVWRMCEQELRQRGARERPWLSW